MGISYSYYKEEGYILVKVTDRITLPEVLSFFESVLTDNNIKDPFYELVDFTEVESFDFGYSESNQMLDRKISLVKHKNHLGTCFIASKNIAKGMSNIFKVVGEDKGMNIQVFRTFDEAIQYIKSNNA